jgi:hypothetical protein
MNQPMGAFHFELRDHQMLGTGQNNLSQPERTVRHDPFQLI